MVKAYIGLGSNIGDGLGTLALAWKAIGLTAGIKTVSISSPYRTAPVGMESDNWFSNAVGLVETTLRGEELLDSLQMVERDFGRVRKTGDKGYQDRTIDLDILLFGDTISANPLLTLPHPEMADRRFVLEPLLEIAPDLVHPVNGLTVSEMNARLTGQSSGARQDIEKLTWPELII